MAKGMTDSKHYQNIAHAIREVSDYEGPIAPAQMADRIRVGGQAANQIGRQEEYDHFWDAFQQNGTRATYHGAFNTGWTAEIFRPKYNIATTGCADMFKNFLYGVESASLKQLLTATGVSLTFHRCGNFGNLFLSANITEIGELDFSTVTRTNTQNIFNGCRVLKTVDKIILPPGQTTFTGWFNNCTALENVEFAGTINANDFDIHWSTQLTHDSLMSIIGCLADRSEQTAYTVTLGTENLAKLTDAEKAMATQKGWTLA